MTEGFLRGSIVWSGVQSDAVGEYKNLAMLIHENSPEEVFIPVDKDAKRRAKMSIFGYWTRLFACFFCDPTYYRHRPQMTGEDVCKKKMKNIHKYLPQKHWPHKLCTVEQCPRGRLTYKGKCLRRDGVLGLACEKSHSHERELIDNAREPCKSFMRLSARALRLAKRLSGEICWTIWNQANLAEEIHRRLKPLAHVEKYCKVCPCGRAKSHNLCFARVDAAQFFKSASVSRGKRRTKQFLARLASKTGKRGVSVLRSALLEHLGA